MNALAYVVEPAPVDEFDLDEPTRPDALAVLPMRSMVYGAAMDAAEKGEVQRWTNLLSSSSFLRAG